MWMWRKLSGFIVMYGPLLIVGVWGLCVSGVVIGVYLND